jgi:tetratricopeptide (TPR) repeat protein
MLVPSAENSFTRGLAALEGGRGVEALALFEAAIEIEKRAGAGSRPQPRYLSFYGLCLARIANRPKAALTFCREATAQEFFNPDLFCNLGRVLLDVGRRKEAYRAIVEGLTLQPNHAGLRRELEKMGRRRRPTLPFLSRANPINVVLGRLSRSRGEAALHAEQVA